MLFISHRSIDQAAAEDLKRRALARGYTAAQIFLDCDPESGIAAGADWEQVIRGGLNRCHALLVVVTKNWRESKWCFAEMVAAKTLGKPIFPILIEPCDVGPELGERQGVQVFDEGEAAYDRLWKSIEAHGLGPHETRPWPPDGGDPCPYPGLLAFSERFATVYFGREPETMAVLEVLNTMRDRGEPRLLMIVGGSGSGKSSLLRAAVLPRLGRNRDWLVLPTLRYGPTPNDDLTLLALLAQELAARFPQDAPARPDWKDLRDKFESDDAEHAARGFFEVTQDLNLACGCRDATTLLPIDQFEELLTSASRPSAERFLRFLHVVLSKNNGRLLVIGTLRSDYLDVYERHPHALQPPYMDTHRLPPFPWERVTDVIVQPAARVGVTFEPALLERLKLDAPTSDALPLLAFTLEKLFRQCSGDKLIELTEYDSLGGMTGAISQAVKNILPAKLPPETEHALRLSFVRHLVQVNEKDEFVRRPARRSALPAAVRPLLEEFVNERLLHTSGTGEAKSIEVSHESLFRCWEQLKAWLEAELTNLRLRRKLELTAREWNESIKPERPTGDEDLYFTMAQLEAVDAWKQDVKLPPSEESFLNASRQRSVSDTQREIERLQQLAEAERKKQQAEAQRASDAIRFSKRLKWAVIGTTTVALVAIVLGVMALKQRSIAVLSERTANESLARNHIDRGIIEIGDGKLLQGLTRLAVAHHFAPPGPVRDSARNLIGGWSRRLGTPLRHEKSVAAVAFSPNGATVVTGSYDNTARLWDAQTGSPRGEPMKHEDAVVAVAFSPDNAKVLTGSKDSTARLWDAETGAPQGETMKHGDGVLTVAFSPNGTTLLTGCDDGMARLWDTRTSMQIGQSMKHGSWILDVAFSPDGAMVLTGSHDETARLWDARTGAPLSEPLKHENEVTAVAFRPDGEVVVTGSLDTYAKLWHAKTGKLLGEPMDHDSSVIAVAFNREGTTVLTGDIGGMARLWDAQTGEFRGVTLKHEGGVNDVAFSPDGNFILTGCSDKTARLFDISGSLRGHPMKHDDDVPMVSFSPDGTSVLTSSGNVARLWRVKDDVPQHKFSRGDYSTIDNVTFSPNGATLFIGGSTDNSIFLDARSLTFRPNRMKHKFAIRALAFSPDGEAVVTASFDNFARLWETKTGSVRGKPMEHARPVNGVAFSPNGKTVLTGSNDGTARLWDSQTGSPQGKPMKHEFPVNAVAFSPDGTTVLTGSNDSTARLWDAQSSAPRGGPLRHEDFVVAVAFSPDGHTVLTGSWDGTARLWNAKTGTAVGEPLKHGSQVLAVAFNPDNMTIVTGGRDKSARFWDTKTGLPRGMPLKHELAVTAIAFSPDGETLLTAEELGQVRLWDIPPPAIDDPERLRLSVELRTTWTFDEQGLLKRLTQAEWLEKRATLEKLGGPCDVVTWKEYHEFESLNPHRSGR